MKQLARESGHLDVQTRTACSCTDSLDRTESGTVRVAVTVTVSGEFFKLPACVRACGPGVRAAVRACVRACVRTKAVRLRVAATHCTSLPVGWPAGGPWPGLRITVSLTHVRGGPLASSRRCPAGRPRALAPDSVIRFGP